MAIVARTVLAALIVTAVIAISLGLHAIKPAHSREAYPGQYAQYDPETRQWFRSLKNSKSGISCCDFIDGARLEDPYWRQNIDGSYSALLPNHSEWTPIPPDAVIDGGNRVGFAIIWRWSDNGVERIRCFIPGNRS